ncbi:MAG: class I SAM-dependent methyltransferase [Mycobacterium sp.]|nr:class I SAM-dependent methyltransferase [Mycobacterium sp.]
MSESDRIRWDRRYAERSAVPTPALPAVFADFESVFPHTGSALELACGSGAAAVWLAMRGLDVHGIDVSDVAIERARLTARRSGVARRCRFDSVDLDLGLPPGNPVDVVVCNRFRDRRLDGAVINRLAPGGLLAICVLSEVGAAPGCFSAVSGELCAAYAALDVVAAGEGDGQAWLIARAAALPCRSTPLRS